MRLEKLVTAVCFPVSLLAVLACMVMGLWAVWSESPGETGLRVLGSALVVAVCMLVALASARQVGAGSE